MKTFENLSIPAPIDGTLPRWVTEDNYPGKHDDMLEDLYRVHWWEQVIHLRDKSGESKPADVRPAEWLDVVLADGTGGRAAVLDRIGSTAMQRAVAQADVLKEDFGVVFSRAAWDVSQKILWTGGVQEFDSFQEFLIDAVPRLKESGREGELSDVVFLMQHFLPILRNVGGDYEPEKLMELPQHWAKARRAVPYLRAKVKRVRDSAAEIDASTEQGKKVLADFYQAVDNVVKVIQDPTIPREGPTGVTRTLFAMDEGQPKVDPLEGHIGWLSGDQIVLFFAAPASWQRAIEHCLRGVVAFETIDPELGFQELDALLHPKSRRPDAK